MKFIVYASLPMILLIVLPLTMLRGSETEQLRKAYGLEAIKALALDAASTFPTKEDSNTGLKYWLRPETPCVFTTHLVHVAGNSRSVSWHNWPSGNTPSCADFHIPKPGTYDPKTTIPPNCSPVWAMEYPGGPPFSFLVVAADGAMTSALETTILSSERISKLGKLGKLPGYYYTNNFIRGGGMENVSIELIETATCEEFKLFRYQTAVDHPRTLRPILEASGYLVGLK